MSKFKKGDIANYIIRGLARAIELPEVVIIRQCQSEPNAAYDVLLPDGKIGLIFENELTMVREL